MVCSPKCRPKRQRKLARRRRGKAVQEHRVDERERQRKSREQRRASGCHAPPSVRKPALVAAEMLESWDKMAALSRSTLARQLSAMARASMRFVGTEAGTEGGLSRSTLGAESRAGPGPEG